MPSPVEFASQIIEDYEHDPLGAHDECDAAIIHSERGAPASEREHLPQPWQRALYDIYVVRPGAVSVRAEIESALKCIRRQFRSDEALQLWRDQAELFAARMSADYVAEYLQTMYRWRTLRACGIEVARAAEAQDAGAIIAAMRSVAAVLREMGVLTGRRDAA